MIETRKIIFIIHLNGIEIIVKNSNTFKLCCQFNNINYVIHHVKLTTEGFSNKSFERF